MDPIIQRWKTLGINLKDTWLQTISTQTNLLQKSEEDQNQIILNSIISNSLQTISNPLLEPNISSKESYLIKGNCILQIEACSNISEPQKKQYTETSNRMLKLCLSDGYQKLYAIEFKKIPQLTVTIAANTKVCVHDVRVVKGLLLLEPELIAILGSSLFLSYKTKHFSCIEWR